MVGFLMRLQDYIKASSSASLVELLVRYVEKFLNHPRPLWERVEFQVESVSSKLRNSGEGMNPLDKRRYPPSSRESLTGKPPP